MFLRLMLSFAPWLSFLVIAHDTLFRVKLGLIVAFVLSVVMGVLRLHRGIILWVGLGFFSCATIAVVFLENMWVLRYMGTLANGALAIGAWLTIALQKPFTLDYAKEHADPALWNDPHFLRVNYQITAIWASTFTINAALAFAKMHHVVFSEATYEMMSYALLIATALFTVWYPAYLRKSQAQKQ